MEALKVTLSGDSAFFKDNVINTVYLTYGNIHRVALLGIFGAILGYNGYSKQNDMLKKKKKNITDYPEFYEKLNDIKIAIVSNGENPSWDIYLLLDCEEAKKIADYIKDRKAIYLPYLGTNDHLANITDVEIVNIEKKITSENENIEILSMVKACDISDKKKNDFSMDSNMRKDIYKYSEYLPIELSKELNQYIKEKITITNMSVKLLKEYYYKVEDKNIVFY